MDSVQHFLRYSLDKKRKIVLIYLDEAGQPVKKNVQVLETSDETVGVLVGRKTVSLSRDMILGAGYARGDTGDLERPDT
ncbi:MAG: hypothetical protein IJ088_16765 [Clostridia bacterium]|nr:hypothetical protein [Clostridia bacterium]